MRISWTRLIGSLILPVTMAVLIPAGILWNSSAVFESSMMMLIFGPLLMLMGTFILAHTISTFALIGRGTLAPWDPPKELVVRGMYSYVRNPMISGVLIIILGESLVFNSDGIFYWCIIFFIINMFNFVFIEEPRLAKRFGNRYTIYKENVPRWIPRSSPWNPMN